MGRDHGDWVRADVGPTAVDAIIAGRVIEDDPFLEQDRRAGHVPLPGTANRLLSSAAASVAGSLGPPPRGGGRVPLGVCR